MLHSLSHFFCKLSDYSLIGAGDNEEVVVSERGFSDRHRFALPGR